MEEAARAMRKRPTVAEARLWEALRAGRFAGAKFRRQHPLGRFVLDFYCPAKRLCIEVDGPVHDNQREKDAARDAALAAANIRVLRFRNEEVLTDLDDVLTRIHPHLTTSQPPPDP